MALAALGVIARVDSQDSARDRLELVGASDGDALRPLRDCGLGNAQGLGGFGRGFEVRQNIGGTHTGESTAC